MDVLLVGFKDCLNTLGGGGDLCSNVSGDLKVCIDVKIKVVT